VWGNFAVVGYLFAALHTVVFLVLRRPSSRWVPGRVRAHVSVLVPMFVLVAKRMTGRDWGSPASSMTAQPEVWAIERAGNLVAAHRFPVCRPARPGQARCGGRLHAVQPGHGAARAAGVPSLDGPWRPMPGLSPWSSTVVVFAIALRVAKPELSVRPVQFVVLTTFTTLSAAVAGNDMPVVALLVLSAFWPRGTSKWAGLRARHRRPA